MAIRPLYLRLTPSPLPAQSWKINKTLGKEVSLAEGLSYNIMDIKTQGSVLQETEHSGLSPIKHLSTGLVFKWAGDWVAAGKAELPIPDPTWAAGLRALAQLCPSHGCCSIPGWDGAPRCGMAAPRCGMELPGRMGAPRWQPWGPWEWAPEQFQVVLPEPGAGTGWADLQSSLISLRGEEGKCVERLPYTQQEVPTTTQPVPSCAVRAFVLRLSLVPELSSPLQPLWAGAVLPRRSRIKGLLCEGTGSQQGWAVTQLSGILAFSWWISLCRCFVAWLTKRFIFLTRFPSATPTVHDFIKMIFRCNTQHWMKRETINSYNFIMCFLFGLRLW